MKVTATDHKDVRLGKQAQDVLDNDAFKLAMAGLKASVIEQWKACPVRDREGQVLLLQLSKLTDKFESLLIGAVTNGGFAQRKIEMESIRDESKARQWVRRVTG